MDKELDLNINSQDYTVELNKDAAKNEFTNSFSAIHAFKFWFLKTDRLFFQLC